MWPVIWFVQTYVLSARQCGCGPAFSLMAANHKQHSQDLRPVLWHWWLFFLRRNDYHGCFKLLDITLNSAGWKEKRRGHGSVRSGWNYWCDWRWRLRFLSTINTMVIIVWCGLGLRPGARTGFRTIQRRCTRRSESPGDPAPAFSSLEPAP